MSIFVNLASYRDTLCETTLTEIFTQADNPQHIFVGICQQNAPSDPECIPPNFPWRSNIRIIRISNLESRGVIYARYLANTLYESETYVCQLDSHLHMHKSWDTICKDTMQQLILSGVKKPILSYYSKSYEEAPSDSNYATVDATVTQICHAIYNKDLNMLSLDGAGVLPSPLQPKLVPFIAGGFFFSLSKFIHEVPLDPKLEFTFVGEEMSLSLRAYTYGYDVYSPTKNIVFHKYTRADMPKVWTDQSHSDKGIATLRYIMGLTSDNPNNIDLNTYRYYIGNERSVDSFYKLIGFDPVTKTISRDFCTDLKTSIQPVQHVYPPLVLVVPAVVVVFLVVLLWQIQK